MRCIEALILETTFDWRMAEVGIKMGKGEGFGTTTLLQGKVCHIYNDFQSNLLEKVNSLPT